MHEKEYIAKIVEKGKKEDMEILSHMLSEAMNHMKNCDSEWYEKSKMILYEKAEGRYLTLDAAKDWVSNMNPSGRWSYEEVSSVVDSYNLEMDKVSAYALFNMLYSDMRNVLGEANTEEDLERYIKAAKDWYFDEDLGITGSEKVYLYWKIFYKKCID
jgi:hypothetical protein